MSDLHYLAARLDRALARRGHAASITLEGSQGSVTLDAPVTAPATPRKIDPMPLRAEIERLMSIAEAGDLVASVTVEGGETFSVAGPDGAFDGRSVAPRPQVPQSEVSPSSDVAEVAAGDTLPAASRAVYVGGAGDLSVVMESGAAATFASVPAGALLPLKVTEIAASTTATAIVAIY
mgnify:CR=1 FL=1